MVVLFRVGQFKDNLNHTVCQIESVPSTVVCSYLDIRIEAFLTLLTEVLLGFKSDTVDTLFSLVSCRQQSGTATISVGLAMRGQPVS
jgi:hypothetical protein